MSVVANAHWSHKWVTPMTGKRDQSEARSEEFRVMLEKLQNQASDKCYIYINNICLQIPCVTTGWAGFEGWKVEPEIPLWSPLGLGGVTLGEVVTAGFEPMASCCLASWGNFEQHLGQVGFRQANGWDTCWNKLEKRGKEQKWFEPSNSLLITADIRRISFWCCGVAVYFLWI